MKYNEKYGQFLVELGKKSGQVAVCEAAHAAYKACCESAGQRYYSVADLSKLIGMCGQYAEDEDDDGARRKYEDELADVRDKSGYSAWRTLVNSGVFHDAVGEVDTYDENGVTVDIKY